MFSITSSRANRWLWRLVVTSVIAIPLVFSAHGKDSFRLPKEIVFRAEAILLLGVLVLLLATGSISRRRSWKEPGTLLPAIAVIWTLTTMLVSTNRTLSFASFLWVCGWALVFVFSAMLAADRKVSAVDVLLIPAIINAVVVLLQEAEIWNPFFSAKDLEHVYHSGLIGNSNDVGVYLIVPTIAAFALIFATPRRRMLHLAITLLLVAAAMANHTLTALIALAFGMIATAFVASRKWGATAVIAVAIFAALSVATYPPLRQRYDRMVRFTEAGYYDSVLSGRLMPYFASFQMFLDHPLTGVGPGCFKWEFFPYQIKIAATHRNLSFSNPENFGEAHNDHLQILAETGVPGYAVFIAALIAIGSISFRRPNPSGTPEETFARLAAFPIAVAFGIVAIAQFPLELAASLATMIYVVALIDAWQRVAEP